MESITAWVRGIEEDPGVTSTPFLISSILALALGVVFLRRRSGPRGPKSLWDPIPGLFNTVQFISNNYRLMTRVQSAMRNETLLRMNLGSKRIYLVTGLQGIRTVFSRDFVHSITNQEQMTRFAFPTLYRMNAAEVKRWEQDKSGVAKVPIPGTEDIPARQRLWFNYEHIYAEYLGKPQYMRPLASRFFQDFGRTLERYPSNDWTSISIRDFCRREVAEAAVGVLFGPDLIRETPDFIDRLWNFDQNIPMLILGPPRWINSKPYRAHDHYVTAVERWIEGASLDFDWEGPGAEADWEPRFGGRAVRELYRWMKDTDWRQEVIAATLGALAFALTSNSIPTTMWMLMKIIQDPSLHKAVRDEIDAANAVDPITGKAGLDSQKIASLPLLQSIWTETLRLYISFNITRDVKDPVTIDGHTIPRGSMIQAPMMVSHYSDEPWAAPEHPASEFWAERHIKYDSDGRRTYAPAGHSTSFFPFGGGANMCPGRQFAKLEVLTAVALVISRFEIRFQRWVTADGKPSDRPARSDLKYCGAGAMPPDRDMLVQWRRIP
ncbi:putative cytochrome P450 [Xylariomycetidae sp. FL2044]|nr:putative cytochrome P450 [Xylariomycetidae sp. FL2044]